jgi:Secretion system C-terminal sorting domain
MTKKILLLTFLISLVNFNLFGQNNPVENLTWSQSYDMFHDYFELNWEEPAQPHNELIGYNIYRNNELYRFQTETSLYNLYSDVYGFVSNCSTEFLGYADGSGFDIHVTAVYNLGQTESNYLQTAHSYGLVLNNNNFIHDKALIFPNPTNGILNIGNENLEKIVVYDISGKVVSKFAPNSQIDLSNLSKGLYLIKLFSSKEIIVDKIVIE